MSNLFEKFVTAEAAAVSPTPPVPKQTRELTSVGLEAKSRVTNTPPSCIESGTMTKSASGFTVHGGKVDVLQKKQLPADPRLMKRQLGPTPTKETPSTPRQKSISPSSSPQNSSSPPQQTFSKRSMHGFTIPKRTDNKLFRDVDLKSREFLNEILPVVKQSYRFPTSAAKLKITGVQLVRNSNLERKYQQKKQELATEGRAEKELADCHAFLAARDSDLARKICSEGVRVGNVPFTSLGKPKMGVCLQRHADILSYKYPDSTAYMILFKTVKGRVKSVPENSVNLEPTPNHDYHVSKNTTLRGTETDIKRLCSATQLYAYEYGDDGVVQRPRHLCPLAIIQYRYGDVSSRRPTSKQSSLSKTATVRTSATRATQVWTGQLFNDETFVSDVRLISFSILFRPTHITSTIVLTHTIPLNEFKQRYLSNCAHISKQREMHIGKNFLLYMQLHSSEIHSFDQLVTFLDTNSEAGVWYCGQRVECFLLPNSSKSVEMGFPALGNRKQMIHCLFVSPYSLASRLAAERGRLAKKAIVAVQQMHDAFGGWQTATSLSYSQHPPPPSANVDFDQPFYATSPATSLLKAPVVKAAFEQQALGEDSLLLDKAPGHPTPKKSAETSSYFQSSKHYSSYRSAQADNASSGVPAVSSSVLYSPTETLAMLQQGGVDPTSPPVSAALPAVSSTTDQYQPSVTGGLQPVLSPDAMVEIQSELYTHSSYQAAPKAANRLASTEGTVGPSHSSPHFYSDDSSHSSHYSVTRRSGSGSSIPYSPTQFSPYEEESAAEEHVSSTDITQLHKIKFLTIPNCEKNFIGLDATQTKTSARTRPAITKRGRTDAVSSTAEIPQATTDCSPAQKTSDNNWSESVGEVVTNNMTLTSAALDATFMAQRTDAAAVSAVKQQETTNKDAQKEVQVVAKKAVPVAPAKAAAAVTKPIPTATTQNSSQTIHSDPRALAKKSKLQQSSQIGDFSTLEEQTQLGKRKAESISEPAEPTLSEGLEGKRRKQVPHPVKKIPLECAGSTTADPRVQKSVPQSITTAPEAIQVEPSQVPVALTRKDGDTPTVNLADPSLLKEVLANPTVQEALAKFQEEEIRMLNCLKLPSNLQNLLWDSSEEQTSFTQAGGGTKDSVTPPVMAALEKPIDSKQGSTAITHNGHFSKLSSFTTIFQQTQANDSTNQSTDKLKVEVIKFTEDIMKKINRKAASTLQEAHEQSARSRRHRKPCLEDERPKNAMELSDVSTDDMFMTFEEELEIEAAEEMSRHRRSSGQASSMDEALAEDIDEALALEELEPLSLGMEEMFDTDDGSGDSGLPRNMGRRSWKLDTFSSNDYEMDMFSDISLDEQEMIRKSLLGEDLADQEKRMRSQVEKMLYPGLEEACITDKTLMVEMKQFYSNLCDLLHGGICHEISCYQDQMNVNNIRMALSPIVTLKDKPHRRSSADKAVDIVVNAERAKFAELVEKQFSKPALTALCADIEELNFSGESFVEKGITVFQKAINDMLERYGFDKDDLKEADTNGAPHPKKLNLLSALCKPNSTVDSITSEKRKELSAKLEDIVRKMDRVRTPTPTPTSIIVTPTPATAVSDHEEVNSSGSGDDVLEEILKLQKQGDAQTSRLIQKSKPITFSLKPSSRWSSSKPPAASVDLTHIPLPEECRNDTAAQDSIDMEAYSPSSQTLNMANFVASQAGKTNSLTESPSEVAKESLMAKRLQRARKLISAYSLTAPKIAPTIPVDPAELRRKKLQQRRHRITTRGSNISVSKKVASVKRMLNIQRLQQNLGNWLKTGASETKPLRAKYLDFRQKLMQYYKLQQAKNMNAASAQSLASAGKLRVPVRPILMQVGKLVKALTNADNQQLQSLLVLNGDKLGQLLQDAGRKVQLFATRKAKLSTKKQKKKPKKVGPIKKIATAKRTAPLPKIASRVESIEVPDDPPVKTIDMDAAAAISDSISTVPFPPLVPYGRESPDHTKEIVSVVPYCASPSPAAFDTSGQEPYWPENPTGADDLLDIPTPAGSSLDFIQRDYMDMPADEAAVEDSVAVFEEDTGDDFARNEAPVPMHLSLENEPAAVSTKQVNGGFYFIFGYHDESCNEAKKFLESDGHRRFDFSDPVSLNEVEQGAPLWIFVHASVLPKIYLLPRLVQLKHFINSHFLMFDIPRQLPERSCTDLMTSGGIIIPDASVLLKSPPGILTHVFGLMRKKREVEGPWRMLIHDHILLQLEKLRGVHGLQEHNTTTARASATLKILIIHHKEQQAHFMYPHTCDVESHTQLLCAKKIQEQHFNTHRHVIIVTDADPERMTEYLQNGTSVVSMIQLINKYLL